MKKIADQSSVQSSAADAKATQQGCVAPAFKLSLHKLYGRHHNLIDRYEISISQKTMDLLLFTLIFLSSITANTFTGLDCIYE